MVCSRHAYIAQLFRCSSIVSVVAVHIIIIHNYNSVVPRFLDSCLQ